ncbi:MAG: 4-(cytidine 5'-diphospho)-2-C-methyl-D-erythritol kinase [Clostridiales bacterium]
MRSVTVRAFAKVNMTLEIGEKRRDGYHQLETLFRGISLHDLVVLRRNGHGIHLICEAPLSWGVPEDRRNLAWQAAELLCRAFPCKIPGVAIKIRKKIPAAAGLAGGSADAAAVLLGMNYLYDLELSAEELGDFAGRLGADVAFCLEPLAALGSGRGEELLPLPPGPVLWVVLLKPPFGLATKEVYEAWDRQNPDSGDGAQDPEVPTRIQESVKAAAEPEAFGMEATARAGTGIGRPGGPGAAEPQLSLLLKGLKENDFKLIRDNMFNDLEEPAFSLGKELRKYKDRLAKELKEESAAAAAGKILLCGSGPTLAVFFDSEEPARRLAERLGTVFSGLPPDEAAGIFLTRTTMDSDMTERIIERNMTLQDEMEDDDEGRDQHDGEY